MSESQIRVLRGMLVLTGGNKREFLDLFSKITPKACKIRGKFRGVKRCRIRG